MAARRGARAAGALRGCGAGHAVKDCGWPDAQWPSGCDALALAFAAVLAACGERRLTLAIALVIAAGHVRHALHGGRRHYEVF